MDKGKIILILDPKNKQDNYAKILMLIQQIEENKDYNLHKIFNTLNYHYITSEAWKQQGFDKSQRKSYFPQVIRYVEESIKNNGLKDISLSGIMENRINYDIYYYFRISIAEEGDIVEFQYLKLLLQALKNIQNRIIGFVEPCANYLDMPEKKDFSMYHKASHYLRLMEFEAFMYSAFYVKETNTVEFAPLSKRKTGRQSTFFPMLEINQKTYEMLTSRICVNLNSASLEPERKTESSEIFDIVQNMLEIQARKEKKVKLDQIYACLQEEVQQENDMIIIEFALFAVLFAGNVDSKEDIKGVWNLSKQVAAGLIQILENVVRHSQLHSGVFTFRKHNKSSKYIRRVIKNRDDHILSSYLEIDVLDYNIKDNIIDNFLHKQGIENQILLENKNKIKISHFFNDYDNSQFMWDLWKEFRKVNPLSCMGLLRLSNVLKKCNGYIQVKSSNEFNNHGTQSVYNKSYDDKTRFSLLRQKYTIPGTQFLLYFPIEIEKEKKHNADIFLQAIGNLVEDNRTYAKFIQYRPKEFILEGLNKFNIKLSEDYKKNNRYEKDVMVDEWANYFNRMSAKNLCEIHKVYYINAKQICNEGQTWLLETFCKGFVKSNCFNDEERHYFAFVSCSESFIKIFSETVVLSTKSLENQQIYLSTDRAKTDVVLCGSNTNNIIENANQYFYSRSNKNFLSLPDSKNILTYAENIDLIPFDSILPGLGQNNKIFDDYIEFISENSLLDFTSAGYKIDSTHMRLGSKVHLEAFYEISILFQKPRIARKIAYKIIQSLVDSGIDVCKNNLLFYGYASYSRMLLETMIEIISHMKEENDFNDDMSIRQEEAKTEFVVYQNDITALKSLNRIHPVIQIYYSYPRLEEEINTEWKIVQIVPISSTLTTFKKMWDVFLQHLKREDIKLAKNYTVFWVKDENSNNNNQPSNIEREYWNSYDNYEIDTHLIKPNPQFFCKKQIPWHNPLKCKWCYPNMVIDERVLIETDPTSTVPTQQLEIKSTKEVNWLEEKSVRNDLRIIKLKKSLQYGHVSRNTNHFQYYFETSSYFREEKKNIKEWLNFLKEQDYQEKNSLNIIVTPHHHTNVEFCHYVNNYYYNGIADVITLDSTKEFKVNVMAKYADLREIIADAYDRGINVKFTYVDDIINTGTTFLRINSLIHSLIPAKIVRAIQMDKIFVLINRLSNNTKKGYVEYPQENYHAFVELNISSIRTYGNSCIMCSLKQNANLFYKRATTKSISEYWGKKEIDYQDKSFDKPNENEIRAQEFNEKGFTRMLASHHFRSKLTEGNSLIEIFNQVLDLFSELQKYSKLRDKNIASFDEEDQANIKYFTDNNISPILFKLSEDLKSTVKAYFKVLCRPFFTYKQKLRQVVLDFYILLLELFLCESFEDQLLEEKLNLSQRKKYLNDYYIRIKIVKINNFIKSIFHEEDERLNFIMYYLIEGLADLRSNYIVRKDSILKINNYLNTCRVKNAEVIDKFYKEYAINILKLVNTSTDETKSLWLEYLLMTGNENQNDGGRLANLKRIDIDKVFLSNVKKESNVYIFFRKFWMKLIIENTRLYYDSMLIFVNKYKEHSEKNDEKLEDIIKHLWDDYYIKNMRDFLKISMRVNPNYKKKVENVNERIKTLVFHMANLLILLKDRQVGDIKRYSDLQSCLKEILNPVEDLKILTQDNENFYFVSEDSQNPVDVFISENIKEGLYCSDSTLRSEGYYIGQGYIIILFDNNYENLKKSGKEYMKLQKIEPFYIYFTCNTEDEIESILKVRRALMYRNKLMHWIEADYNNNAMPFLLKQRQIGMQLARDKAGDHSSRPEISIVQKNLQSTDLNEDRRNWLLLKSYVNLRIARLFRNCWSDRTDSRIDLYFREKDEIFDKCLTNLGENLFADTLPGFSPKRYFEILDNTISYKVNIYGNTLKTDNFGDLENIFKDLKCINNGKYYYRSEYIFCILLDIFFSAIKNSINWTRILSENLKGNDTLEQYLFLKNNDKEIKCSINIYTELCSKEEGIYYLVIRNKKIIYEDRSLEYYNYELNQAVNFNKMEGGLSLATIKWYLENLWEERNKAFNVVFKYEKNKENEYNELEFIAKLPILVRRY